MPSFSTTTRRSNRTTQIAALAFAVAAVSAGASAKPGGNTTNPDLAAAPILEPIANGFLDGDWLFPQRSRGTVALFDRLSIEGGLATLSTARPRPGSAANLTGSLADSADAVNVYDVSLAWNAATLRSPDSLFTFSLLAGARATGLDSADAVATPLILTPIPVAGAQCNFRLGDDSSLRASVVGGADSAAASHYFELRLESIWRIAECTHLSLGIQHLDAASSATGLSTTLQRDAAVFSVRWTF
ncbi:MAG: hypothetical protein ACREJO_05585 [Phycisphaerales bacterium]